MGKLPRSEYKEFSSDQSFLDSIIGKQLDFWYGDPDADFMIISEWEFKGDYLLGFDKDRIVFECAIPISDLPYREVN